MVWAWCSQFDCVYFNEVGMSFSSLFLANQRLAPIQIVGQGDAWSSESSTVDYRISGEAAEPSSTSTTVDTTTISASPYSERLLLLSSNSIGHAWVTTRSTSWTTNINGARATYQSRVAAAIGNSRTKKNVTVNIIWPSPSITHEALTMIADASEDCYPPPLYRFYIGGTISTSLEASPPLQLIQQITEAVLGRGRVSVVSISDESTYLLQLSEGDVTFGPLTDTG
jgi:hypothetical protein